MQSAHDNLPYYVLQTFPNGEEAAVEWLSKYANVDAYCPLYSKFIRPRRQKGKGVSEVRRPVFSGYLFVQTNLVVTWHLISQCPHIYGYLTNADEPVRIRQEIMDEIIARVDSGVYDESKDAVDQHIYSLNECVLIQVADITTVAVIIGIEGRKLEVLPAAMGAARPLKVHSSEVLPAKIIVQSENCI